ncbi:MAG: hypothetical protein ACLPY5_16835 [Candidatus Bathyarchaeia archaeon]
MCALARRAYLETNHDLTKTIVLGGTARSGTTWLAQVLGKIMRYRLIFEPYFPEKVPEYKLKFRQYLRPDEVNPAFRSFTEHVLTGRIRNGWTDSHNRSLIANGRIVKEVRASLFLKWIRNNFRNVTILYMLRHPCAVVDSWNRAGFQPSFDIECMLEQKVLVKDYLDRYMPILRTANTDIAKMAFVWCIDQVVTLNTMEHQDYLVTTYEDLWLKPNDELKLIMEYIGARDVEPQFDARSIISDTVGRDSAILANRNPLEAWRSSLTEHQIETVLEIVRKFSLDVIYDDNPLPHNDKLASLLETASRRIV